MDVFISYARSTEAQAQHIAGALRDAGYAVWMDDQLPAHRAYSEVIEERLQAAKAVLVLWSADAAASEWVRSEANKARAAHKLVQASLDGAALPMPFDQIQCVDLSRWKGGADNAGWRTIRASLDDLIARRAPDVAAAPIPERRAPPWRSRYALWIALIVLGNLFGVGWWMLHHHAATRSTETLRTAVFDFATPAGDKPLADLASGISDSVVSTMGAVQLPLVSRAETARLAPAERLARAKALGASFVLDGDIRRIEGGVTIAARVDNLDSGTTVWSASFDGPIAAVTRLETQVAAQTIDTLRCATQRDRGEADSDSFALLLSLCNRRGGNSGDSDLAAKLAARFPDSAHTQASYAITLVQAANDAPPMARGDLLTKADAAARRALALDPKHGDTYYALYEVANARHAPRRDLEAIELRGLRADPRHASLNNQYAEFLQRVGRVRDSLAYARLGLAGDPLSPVKPLVLASALSGSGHDAEAGRVLDDLWQRWPSLSVWRVRSRAAVLAGDRGALDRLLAEQPADARGAAEVACLRDTFDAVASAKAGRGPGRGVVIVRQCRADEIFRASAEVGFFSLLGANDDAFAALEDLRGGGAFEVVLFTPADRALRRDPRFLPLLRGLGLADYWRADGKWPDFCTEPGLSFDCRTAFTTGR